MSDEQQDLNLEDVGAGAEDAAGPRRGGLLSGMLLNILKWAAIGIGAVIVVVTTTVITVRIVSKGNQQQGLAAISPEYKTREAPWAAFDDIEQIRGTTSDDPPAIFLLQISLAYDEKDKLIGPEIGGRKRQIQNLVLTDISQKMASDLVPGNYPKLQAELLEIINAVMKDGKLKDVYIRQFVVQK